MRVLRHLFANNRAWAAEMTRQDPEFFRRLSRQQTPQYPRIGCGGVLAALRDDKLGLIDNWLRHVQDVRGKHQGQLDALATEEQRHDRLCELNVMEQVVNVCQTTVVRGAWARGQALAVHGWVY